jgi:hypothetical protein
MLGSASLVRSSWGNPGAIQAIRREPDDYKAVVRATSRGKLLDGAEPEKGPGVVATAHDL